MTKYLVLFLTFAPSFLWAADHYVGGRITSLMGSAAEPAIRIDGKKVPDKCDGGIYGWLYFSGSQQEKQWLYSTALAMAVTDKVVTVYTNADGGTCRINNIQVTSGLK